MWFDGWRLVAIVVGVVTALGGFSVGTGNSYARTPYPDPLHEEILDGQIVSDMEGNLFVPIEVHFEQAIFRDSTSSIIESIPLKKFTIPILSSQGNFMCIVTLDPAATKESPGTCVKSMYDRSGHMIWNSMETIQFDDPIPSPVVSDLDGSTVEVTPGIQTLAFRNKTGTVTQTVKLVANPSYSHELGASAVISQNGKIIAAVAIEEVPIPHGVTMRDGKGNPIPARDGNPQLVVLDNTGKELFRHYLDELGFGNRVLVSPDGKYITACSSTMESRKGLVDSGIYVFKRDGTLIGKYAIHTPGTLWHPLFDVLPDEKRIVLANYDRIMLIDPDTGKIIWDRQFSLSSPTEKKRFITDVRFLGPSHDLIVTWTTDMEQSPYRRIDALLVDESGEIIREINSIGTQHSRGRVHVGVSHCTEKAGILTAQGLVVVER